MNVEMFRGQKRVSDAMELEFQGAMGPNPTSLEEQALLNTEPSLKAKNQV